MILEEILKIINLACLVAFLIIAGRLAGALAQRIGIPRVIGELLAGFVLGVSGLGLLSSSYSA